MVFPSPTSIGFPIFCASLLFLVASLAIPLPLWASTQPVSGNASLPSVSNISHGRSSTRHIASGFIKNGNDVPTSVQQNEEKTRNRKVEFEHNLPKELKIVGIRHLQEDDWRDKIEIEIKNVSEQPIYFMRIYLEQPEVLAYGLMTAYILDFGRRELISHDQRPTPDDETIKPGESYIFKIPKKQIENVAAKIRDSNASSEVNKIVINIDAIRFMDGTGYDAGHPIKK